MKNMTLGQKISVYSMLVDIILVFILLVLGTRSAARYTEMLHNYWGIHSHANGCWLYGSCLSIT